MLELIVYPKLFGWDKYNKKGPYKEEAGKVKSQRREGDTGRVPQAKD